MQAECRTSRPRRIASPWLLLAGTLALCPALEAQWIETFDSYSAGPLCSQSNWEEWVGSSGVDATVSPSAAFAGPQGLVVEALSGQSGDDVVQDFALLPQGRPNHGGWVASVRTRFPSNATGTGFVVLLNQYRSAFNWSVQVRFDTSKNKVQNDGRDFGELPLVRDLWTPLHVLVDLDRDRLDLFYGGEALIADASWKEGRTGGGIAQIAALDLYAGEHPGGVQSMFVDQVQLESSVGPPCLLYLAPSPALPGDHVTVKVVGPGYPPGTRGNLYAWTVNGAPFVLPLARFRFDANGEWTSAGDLTPGVGNIDIGFKVLALVPGERPSWSNLEVLVVH